MRFLTVFMAPVFAIVLVMPAFAQEADQQTRQQIEAVHQKWVDAVNKGDADAATALSTSGSMHSAGRSVRTQNCCRRCTREA